MTPVSHDCDLLLSKILCDLLYSPDLILYPTQTTHFQRSSSSLFPIMLLTFDPISVQSHKPLAKPRHAPVISPGTHSRECFALSESGCDSPLWPCGVLRICSVTSAPAPHTLPCEEMPQALHSHGLRTEPSDQCLSQQCPAVYFHGGINVYFDMPLVLF